MGHGVVLYGGRHSNDLETAVFLDKEGDQYEFEPYAPEFDYRIKRGVPAEEALKKAKKFVSFHNAFWRSQLSRILDEKGDADSALMPSLSEAYIRRMYELIVLFRTFDQLALYLQREGRLGTYASILGQEASQIGSAFADRKNRLDISVIQGDGGRPHHGLSDAYAFSVLERR